MDLAFLLKYNDAKSIVNDNNDMLWRVLDLRLQYNVCVNIVDIAIANHNACMVLIVSIIIRHIIMSINHIKYKYQYLSEFLSDIIWLRHKLECIVPKKSDTFLLI